MGHDFSLADIAAMNGNNRGYDEMNGMWNNPKFS